MRLLVVEDDPKIREFVGKGLRQEGHTVETASTGPEGQKMWDAAQYDAVILDIMLPGASGLALLKRARNARDTTPVLILSAKGAVHDRVEGLDLGADDYMAKPFSLSELSARIHAITRRNARAAAGSGPATSLSCGGITLDLLRRAAFRDGRRIDLQPREFALLELMMENPDRPLAKTFLLERIWNSGFDPQTNIVDVLVCRLRRKLDSGPGRKTIRTMRGVGYVFSTK